MRLTYNNLSKPIKNPKQTSQFILFNNVIAALISIVVIKNIIYDEITFMTYVLGLAIIGFVLKIDLLQKNAEEFCLFDFVLAVILIIGTLIGLAGGWL